MTARGVRQGDMLLECFMQALLGALGTPAAFLGNAQL